MHVLFDASSLMKNISGVGVYALNLVANFLKAPSDVSFHFFLNALKGRSPECFQQAPPLTRITRRRLPGKVLLEVWKRWNWPKIEDLAREAQADIFHSPNFLYQPTRIKRIITTIHDVAFLKAPTYGSRYAGQFHRQTLMRNLAAAASIITVSQSVKRDIINLCKVEPGKITVIPNGVDPRFEPARDPDSIRKQLGLQGYPSDFILSVGTLEPRKNFPSLVHAFASITKKLPDWKLLIAGQYAEDRDRIKQTISDCGLGGKVILTGYIEMAFLIRLVQAARLAVFPSWDEGFGIPPLEAIACGVPVVASDIPVHREILQDAVFYSDAVTPNSLSETIMMALEDSAMKEIRRQKGLELVHRFSWAESARLHLELYRKSYSA
jgi:glycosyltransferase involved in cell wall biosynthesis